MPETTLLQSTAAVVVGRGYLASDHLSTATGLDPAITISKNGGNFANPNAGASVMTEIESTGWYKFSLAAEDTDTLGPLIVRGTHATMDNIEVVYQVVAAVTAANVTQWLGQACAAVTVNGVPEVDVTHWLGTAAATPTVAGVPEVDVTHMAGGTQTVTDLKDFADTGYDPSTHKVAGVVLTDTTTTATTATNLTNLPAVTTDWLTAAGVKADAVTKIQTGLATPTNITAGTITTVTNLTNAPSSGDFTSTMKTSLNAATPAVTITDSSSDAVIADAVWNAATASYGTAGTYGALIESGNVGNGAIVAASVTGAVGSVTGSVGSVGTGGITAASIATGAIDKDALAADVIDDIWQGTALTEAYATDGAAATPAQLLYMIWAMLSEKAVVSTTLTVNKLDGTTEAMTFTLDSATAPTTITRAS